MELLTARLRLRPPIESDVEVIWSVHADPAAVAHNPSDALGDRDEALALYQRWDEQWQRHGFGYWVVLAGSTIVGFCGFKMMDLDEQPVLNLFYRFAPEHWGRGYAREAAIAAVEWARVRQPDRLVIARVRPDNTPSHRVAAAAGLIRAPELDRPGFDGPDQIYISRHGPDARGVAEVRPQSG